MTGTFKALLAVVAVAVLVGFSPLASIADASDSPRIASESKKAERAAKRAERAAAREAKKKERAQKSGDDSLAKAKTGKRGSGSESKPDLGGDDPLEGL